MWYNGSKIHVKGGSMLYPLPSEFLKIMQNLLGCEYPAFLNALDQPPALALRLNPKRSGAATVTNPYRGNPVPWARNGYYLIHQSDVKPGNTIAHAAGAFYLQEASAMASAATLDPQPGERVLDLCAAPGGKSTQIAAAMNDQGILVSNDPDPSRAAVLAGNLERMGAANAIVVCSSAANLADRWPEYFDAILVDAPCSGEGMFRRDPAARTQWKPASPGGCARRQAEILNQAERLLRPGGRLVYSTCTFNLTENENTVQRFLSRHQNIEPEDFCLPGVGSSRNGMLRLLPHRVCGDGHFVARMRKTGNAAHLANNGAPISDREAFRLLNMLENEIGTLPGYIREMKLLVAGQWLYCHPQINPPMNGIRVISPGLRLARIGRSHVEPGHALAMALCSGSVARHQPLEQKQAQAWLCGEALPIDGSKGWTLVSFDDMPLGWGKRSEGVLKNHLPKGLRKSGVDR